MDDVRAVMDAVGSKTAFVLGLSEGGPMSVLFAASHPERTRALVLYGSFPRITSGEGYPWGFAPEQVEPIVTVAEQSWGDGTFTGSMFAPGDVEARLGFFARFAREGASPGAMIALVRMLVEIDVRDVLPSVTVPTSDPHRAGDGVGPIEGAPVHRASEFRARGSSSLTGDHSPVTGDTDAILDEIEEFVTGRPALRAGADRVFATVMFTDIVDSTPRAATMGDRRWSELLEGHHRLMRQHLKRFGGQEVKTTGDGFLTTFDGPARAIQVRPGNQRGDPRRSASCCARVYTPANASGATVTSVASLSTSPRA